ncbi:MAG: hypothetical protein II127_02470 [Ruminococcus sp.]|nr:hypothetical protein [Ruminococcus sp.]
MIDIKWQNGDLAVDDAGNAVPIGDTDARFQRALMRMTVPKGSFIYDRALGVRSGGTDSRRRELLLAEALADCPDTRVRVTGMTENGTTVEIIIGGESRTEEVRAYGNV